jgi:circadian clock protein KaiC
LTHAPRANSNEPDAPLLTGVEGLDDVLSGGFAPNRMYLVEGVPGSGKTTLALAYMLEGVRRGERVLYVTLSETEEELHSVARSHGWTLEGVPLRELSASERGLEPDQQYTVFHASEMELGETIRAVLDDVVKHNPSRIVIDSLSELRLLSGNALRYRRQILALKQFFTGRGCTVLLLDDLTAVERDLQVQSIAHGVIVLEHLQFYYGGERRRLRVIKYRGRAFRSGHHDYKIERGGLRVFPRLVAGEHRQAHVMERLKSGIPELDALLGGGIERGTSTLLVGAAGVGKSSLAAQFVSAAAARGQASSLYLFDEGPATLLTRCAGLGIDLESHLAAGRVLLQTVDPAELSPGEFVQGIRRAVEDHHATIVVIDSLNGYLNAMPEERALITQLHELLRYLGQKGVATIMIGAHQGLIGSAMSTPMDASYLADAVILLRYFEAHGAVRQAISVIKKRGGAHERTIRELRLETGGIRIGEPLHEFRGVLTGTPTYQGSEGLLSKEPGR